MKLFEATTAEVRDAETELAMVPVGSTEQHGPHAPLGTDAMHAASVAESAAAAFPGEVLVTPAIPVGISEEHRQFAGTLWVSPDTFRRFVRETVESLAHHGAERVVLVNGHGGNTDALREVAAALTREGDVYATSFTWFEAVGKHADRMGHGGPLETALLRHTRPEQVREDQVEAAAANASDRWGEWVSGVNLAYDADEFTENGVVGDPREGDAALGAELLDRATEALVALLEAVATRELTASEQ
jgi:creatinine amidohydrolase